MTCILLRFLLPFLCDNHARQRQRAKRFPAKQGMTGSEKERLPLIQAALLPLLLPEAAIESSRPELGRGGAHPRRFRTPVGTGS